MIYISEGFTFSVKHSAGMNCSMSLNSPRNYLFFFNTNGKDSGPAHDL